MDKVDIIMPVHNCKKYINDAINSVKEQTYKNWYLIIIDDYSEDDSLKIIEEVTKDIKEKVKIIKLKENVGVAGVRNIGLKSSTSKYIAYLDGDDVWNKEKLEKQISFMETNNYLFTYTNFIYKKGNKIKKVKVFPKSLSYKEALKNTFILTSTVIINTEKIDRNSLLMPNVESEDTATWWEILKRGSRAYGLNEHLTTYRVHRNGLSFNKFKNLKRTWNLYRKYEKLSFIKSIYCFINYAINASIKRIV